MRMIVGVLLLVSAIALPILYPHVIVIVPFTILTIVGLMLLEPSRRGGDNGGGSSWYEGGWGGGDGGGGDGDGGGGGD